MVRISGAALLVLAGAVSLQTPPSEDRLYGRVLTADGDELEGYLRWDRDETSWADLLEGEKEVRRENLRQAERLDEDFRRRRALERSISLPGLRISWDEDDDDPPTTGAGVRFGHLRSLEVDGRRAVLSLKSGRRLELAARSSDIGRRFRGLVVEAADRGEIELSWSDLERIDFLAPPPGRVGAAAERLRGTLRTRSGLELTGFVAWDRDEALTSDVLDGEEGGRARRIPFGEIAKIAGEGSAGARVTRTSGEQLLLRGSNDVGPRNRGIEISDPTLGRAIVGWSDFESLTLAPAGAEPTTYASFDGGRALYGKVETSAGTGFVGRIRWDNDQEFTWEILEGRLKGVDFAVELASVSSIERTGSHGARVTLRDGRTLALDHSSDVDETNRGIFVELEDGETRLVRWRDFVRVTFEP